MLVLVRRVVVLPLCVMGLLLGACGSATSVETATVDTASSDVASADVPAASDFPQFTARTVAGDAFDFGSLEGQDTVLWFWAPW